MQTLLLLIEFRPFCIGLPEQIGRLPKAKQRFGLEMLDTVLGKAS